MVTAVEACGGRTAHGCIAMESQAVVVVVLLRRRRNGAAGGSRRGRVARFASNDDLAKGLLDRGCG